LARLKELESSPEAANMPRLNVLYAYNYDRLNDSVQAKSYAEKFFRTAPMDKIVPADYELAIKVLSKFPGSEAQVVNYLEKAIENDTSKVVKLNYLNQAADMFAKSKNSAEQLKYIERVLALKGTTSEADYYKMTNAAIGAKEYERAIAYSKRYMAAYPDKPQPYTFFRRAAVASTTDSAKVIMHLDYLDSIYTVLGKDKFKKEIFNNLYFRLVYYNNSFNNLKKDPDFKVKADGSRTPIVDQFLATCQKAVDVTDQMMLLYTDPADENNKFATDTKGGIMKTIDYYSKPQTPAKKTGGAAGNGATSKGK
jgi:tetratricopeptide (TPR) repeat protein